MNFKRITSLVIALLLTISCVQMSAFAEDEIKVYIDNTLIDLKNPATVVDGVAYFPMEEVFFKLGVYMEWSETDECWIGTGNNGEIRVTPDDWRVEVDWIPLEMPGPVRTINGVIYLPIYIIEDATHTEPATYDAVNKRIDIVFPDLEYEGSFKPFDVESIVHLLPEGEKLMPPGKMYDVKMDASSDDSLMSCRKVTVEGMPFTEALEIETFPTPDGSVPMASYSIQQDVFIDTGTFNAGDCGMMTFWARATKTTDESGTAGFRPAYEQLGKWQKAQEKEVRIGHEWKKYYLPMYSGIYTLQSGASHLTYSVGYKPQIIQIAELQMYNYGKSVDIEMLEPGRTGADYKGMEANHLWRKEAWKRIEKYRKDDMAVQVVDKDGNPVEDASVSFDMTENEFMMGCAVSDNEFVGLDDSDRVGLEPENSRVAGLYLDMYNHFNTGVSGNEMKSEGTRSLYRTARNEMNTFLDLGKRVRGHCLSWDDEIKFNDYAIMDQGYYDINQYDYNLENLLREATGEVWMFRDVISEWDGLNEPYDSSHYRKVYTLKPFAEVFKMTKAVDPKSNLIVNETGMEGRNSRAEVTRATSFIRLPDELKYEHRGPVDGIGIQGHCGRYLYPMGMWWDIEFLTQAGYDTASITEYDFMNENEEGAARHLYDTFLACYSHPKCNAFIIWGLQDTMHWRNDAPFYDRHWNEKPEYAVWKYMYDELYATHETVKTDANGLAKIRGYRGKYDITVDVNGVKTVVQTTIVNSDNTDRDNMIKVVFDGANLNVVKNPNPQEVYAKRHVTNDNYLEAYAEYLAAGADKWIGIYEYRDEENNRIRSTSDGLQNTFHYIEGEGYAQYELVEKAARGNISVDFRAPQGEVYNYEILTSLDGENYTSVYKGSSDVDKTIDLGEFMFVRVKSDNNKYMGISEVDIHAEKE